MEPRLHRRVQRYGWDKAVQDYDRYFVPLLRRCSERSIQLLNPQPAERILDVATGTGVAAFMAAERVGDPGEIVATDISEKMVRQTEANAQERGITNMRFERADAEDLPSPDGSFDAAMCVLGLMYPADPQRAIEEMYRVLRPGARAVACVWGRRDRCGWAEIFPITDARVESDVCPMFFQLGLPGALTFAFQRAGFKDVQDERMDVTLTFASAHELLQALFAGGPVALAYSRFSPEVREQVHREFLDSVEQHRRGEQFDIPGEFVFALAHR
ncbi:MAG: methyltransferase domain-containing protein [Chloroflexi bacterium]|nr:MAG: methyltransferase domain-containing protein [Chloroflexota bacterium]